MTKQQDAFSSCHPAVALLFFAGAILLCAVVSHPAYLAVAACAGASCCLTLKGRSAWRVILGMLPLFAVLSALNPLFNPQGERVLFTILGRPYTWEALCWGMSIAGMVAAVLLWFVCWNQVMSGDRLTYLFGWVFPALSLVLVLVLRLIPAYRRKANQIRSARSCLGMGGDGRQVQEGVTVLSAMTSWALEGSVVTADSMRARGFGQGKRTGFPRYRFRTRDALCAALLLALLAVIFAAIALGWASARFTPVLSIAPASGVSLIGLLAWTGFFFFPTILNLREALLWHFLRSNI